MARIKANLTDEDKDRVQKYANDNGLQRSRAYAELIRRGLDAAEEEGIDGGQEE